MRTFSDLGLQGDAGAHFRLRYRYHALIVDSDEFEVRPIAVIVFPTIFPSFFATNCNTSLSVELHDGMGTVLRDTDILWFNLSLQVNGSEAIACCNSALNVMETDLWTFNHTRELPSMVRSHISAGILKNVTLSIQYALGDNYTLLFHFTDFRGDVNIRSPSFSVTATRLVVVTQPGGSGLDIDALIPAHNSPGVGDGAPEGCRMARFPLIKLYGRNSLNEEYPFSTIVSPFGAVVGAAILNITAGNSCTISHGATSYVNLVTGEVTFNELVISGCVQESLGLRFASYDSSFEFFVDSLPFDIFGDPYSALITDISTNGIQAFDIRWAVPHVDRLHPLIGVIFEVRACIGDCINSQSCPSACTTLRDTCENYGFGGDGDQSCSRICNASELQLLPAMMSTSPMFFNQTLTSNTNGIGNWSICDDGFPWPSSNLCAYNSLGTQFHVANGAVALKLPSWPVLLCTELTNIIPGNGIEVIILKPGVVYQFSAVSFNSHRVNRNTSPIFSRPSVIDDSAPDSKFTMYSSVSVSPVTFQFYLTSPAPTLWRPRLGYIVDIVPMGDVFEGHSHIQSMFFWDQGCDGYQSTAPSLLQTNQTPDATYHLDSQMGYAFSMFVMRNGMPLVNKPYMLNGLRSINYSIPYNGQQLSISGDFRYTVRVYTVNALGVSAQPGHFSFAVTRIQPSVLSTDGTTIVTMFGSGLGLPTYENNMRIKINGLECTALVAGSYNGEHVQFVAPRSYGLAPSWSIEMGIMSSMPIVVQGKSWFRYGAPKARKSV